MSDEPDAKKIKTADSVDSLKKCVSPKDVDDETKKFIADKFLVKMPDDFYDLWSILHEMNPDNPSEVLKMHEVCLAGPYDVLLGKRAEDDNTYLLHHRFFYDVPEFQTVFISAKKNSSYHIGYYRDVPDEDPLFVASNNGTDCKLTVTADNILAALHHNLQQSRNKSKAKPLIEKLEAVMKEKGYETGKQTKKIKTRAKKIVSRGFHGAGIVVPVDENEVGWREVPQTIGELKKLFASIVKKDSSSDKSADELQEMITYVQFANDELDYGQGLELGNDIFCYGEQSMHGYVKSLLPMAYMLLGYSAFEKIITAHLDKRSKDSVGYLT